MTVTFENKAFNNITFSKRNDDQPNIMHAMDATSFTCEGGMCVDLALLTNVIRGIDRNGDQVNAIVSSILANNTNLIGVHLDAKVDKLGEKVLQELVSRSNIRRIDVKDSFEAEHLPGTLRRCVIPNVKGKGWFVVMMTVSMTAKQARDIFDSLLATPVELILMLAWDSYDQNLLESFSRFLQDPASPHELSLGWRLNCSSANEILPARLFEATCKAISKSPTLESLHLLNAPVEPSETNHAATCLANAIADSSTIEQFRIDEQTVGGLTIDDIQRQLVRTPPARTFDLLTKRYLENDAQEWWLSIERTTPFKPLLSQTLSLQLWPHVLARANTYRHLVIPPWIFSTFS